YCSFMLYDFLCFIFFFFQAEDGIRDFHVTGVQTCALPIWPSLPVRFRRRTASLLASGMTTSVPRSMVHVLATSPATIHPDVSDPCMPPTRNAVGPGFGERMMYTSVRVSVRLPDWM